MPKLWSIIKNTDLLGLALREMAESEALEGVWRLMERNC